MRFAALLCFALVFSACPPKPQCNAPCTCEDGRMGSPICSSSISAGRCICDDLGGGPGGSGGGTGGGGGAIGGGTGGSTGGGGGAQPSITLQQFCTEYPAAACATRIACGRYSDAGLDICLQREKVTELCRRAGLGFVDFHGEGAALCLMQLQSGALNCASDFPPCGSLLAYNTAASIYDIFTSRPNGCGTMTCGAGTRCDERCTGPQCLPPLDAGDLCSGLDGIARDCPAGTTCTSTDGGPLTCLGVAGRGQECSRVACAEVDYCDYSQATPTCRPRLTNESPCGPNDVCLDGVCRTDGRCGALDAGARCQSAVECGGGFNAGAICVGLQRSADGGTLDAGVCGPRPRLGEACSRDWARLYDSCRMSEGESCLDGVCTYLEPFSRPLGAECPLRPWGYTSVPFFGFTVCERGLGCRPSATAHPPQTGRCQPAQTEGGPCRDEFECAAGLSCFSGEDGGGRCTTLARLGESCEYRGCLRELSCDLQSDGGQTCQPLSQVDGGCSTQTCVPTAMCVAGVCERLGATGEPCAYGFQCQSEVCQLNQCVAMCMR